MWLPACAVIRSGGLRLLGADGWWLVPGRLPWSIFTLHGRCPSAWQCPWLRWTSVRMSEYCWNVTCLVRGAVLRWSYAACAHNRPLSLSVPPSFPSHIIGGPNLHSYTRRHFEKSFAASQTLTRSCAVIIFEWGWDIRTRSSQNLIPSEICNMIFKCLQVLHSLLFIRFGGITM